MQKNIVQPNMPHLTLWCMHIACWIPKAIEKHPEYVILLDFPSQQWLHECVSALRFTCIASRVLDIITTENKSRQQKCLIFNLATCSDLRGSSSGQKHKIHRRKSVQRFK